MRFFSVRIALALIVATFAMLIIGGVEISESLRFRSPRVMTYEQFTAQMPQEGWYRITGCYLKVVESAWQEDKKTHAIDKAFVPLGSTSDKDDDSNAKTTVMVEETDPAILDTVREAQQINGKETVLDFVKKNPDRVFLKQDVEGMVKAGIKSDSSTRPGDGETGRLACSQLDHAESGRASFAGAWIGAVHRGRNTRRITGAVLLAPSPHALTLCSCKLRRAFLILN